MLSNFWFMLMTRSSLNMKYQVIETPFEVCEILGSCIAPCFCI